MSWFGRRARFDGTAGRPPSGNGASSFHLFWDGVDGPWTAVEAVLVVESTPPRPDLWFWALQASFAGPDAGGAGHLGLQWCPPGRPMVNWGGYGPTGAELDGSVSPLPTTDGNPNTRVLDWRAGVPYRLRIEAAEPLGGGDPRRRWRGSVTDLDAGAVVVVRDLYAVGDRLADAMVWSEVFAPCDAAPLTVRWGGWVWEAADGRRVEVRGASVNYQAVADGGCTTTDSSVGDGWFVQRTGVERRTPQGSRLER